VSWSGASAVDRLPIDPSQLPCSGMLNCLDVNFSTHMPWLSNNQSRRRLPHPPKLVEPPPPPQLLK
jgi:hypothetical protein